MKRYPVGSILINECGELATITSRDEVSCTVRYYKEVIHDRCFSWEIINTWMTNSSNHKIIIPFKNYIDAVTN